MIQLLEWFLEWLFEDVLGALLLPVMKKLRQFGGKLGRSNPRAVPEMMLNLFRMGDYGNALAFCNILSKAGQDLDVFRANILMQLGQLDEAVSILTKAVDRQKNAQLAALANCTLGEVYLFQDRLDAAFDAFNTALKLWPERAALYRSLAEVWLRRGNREETLRCARLGADMEKASPGVTPETKASNLAVALAVLASAAAASRGDVYEVRQLTAEAAGYCGGISVCDVAQTHMYCAIACNSLGDFVKSGSTSNSPSASIPGAPGAAKRKG